jgi:hypothetical protein
MFVAIALAVCLAIGIARGRSRFGKLAWVVAAVCATTLAAVGYGYRYDAKKLPEWFEKRNDVLFRLRTNKICLDMETHPEHWQGTGLEYPCIGYSVRELQNEIAEQEVILNDWNTTIHDRQALLKARESGQFGFIQRWVGNPYE